VRRSLILKTQRVRRSLILKTQRVERLLLLLKLLSLKRKEMRNPNLLVSRNHKKDLKLLTLKIRQMLLQRKIRDPTLRN
jgi:hypothetical protein